MAGRSDAQVWLCGQHSQGKVVAAAIINLLNGHKPVAPSLVNSRCSLIGTIYGVSVAAVYELSDEGIVSIPGAL